MTGHVKKIYITPSQVAWCMLFWIHIAIMTQQVSNSLYMLYIIFQHKQMCWFVLVTHFWQNQYPGYELLAWPLVFQYIREEARSPIIYWDSGLVSAATYIKKAHWVGKFATKKFNILSTFIYQLNLVILNSMHLHYQSWYWPSLYWNILVWAPGRLNICVTFIVLEYLSTQNLGKKWISNFIPHFTKNVITYPYWDQS